MAGWLGVAQWVWVAIGVALLGAGLIMLRVRLESDTRIERPVCVEPGTPRSGKRQLFALLAGDAGIALVTGAVVGAVIFLAEEDRFRRDVRRDNVRFVREVAIQADPRNKPFAGLDLRDAQLDGLDLSGADLRCADLTGADLSYAKLNDAELHGADLSEADLVPVVWTNTQYDAETDWPDDFDHRDLDVAIKFPGSRTGCPED